ncbi:MAG: hypothetical protein GXP62_09090, partial [Oligoflexia bacterium]|nr:hypothetical protein [Oligoflexia bacterium]
GAAAALAGTSAILATRQDTAMTEATTPTELEAAHGRQRSFAYASVGLSGVSAVCVGLGIAW